ncbi:hypothetical protein PLESTB_001547800 [Pleodorina starrii]|uniref:Uncharacterized protein n=1 Tax=Pleodorina starrii TaxID=330485 RepID=A0A9W6BX39_9CHLO|nr:hypothetical protein PLESTB_001547800 [Pleodorina starrii]
MEARPPTDEEIARMNEYFQLQPDEDVYIQEVGQLACVAPLPEGFEEIPDDTGTGAMYRWLWRIASGRSGPEAGAGVGTEQQRPGAAAAWTPGLRARVKPTATGRPRPTAMTQQRRRGAENDGGSPPPRRRRVGRRGGRRWWLR